MQEAGAHEIVGGRSRPCREVGGHPRDVVFGLLLGGADGQGAGGDVHRGHHPAPPREPQRVAGLAAAEIERGAGSDGGHLPLESGVRGAATRAPVLAVAVLPVVECLGYRPYRS